MSCGTFTMSALVCQLLCVLLRHVVDGVELRLCMPSPDSARVSCRVERRLRLPLEVRKDLLREQLCRTSGVLRVRPIVTHLQHAARSEEHTSELQSLMRISY